MLCDRPTDAMHRMAASLGIKPNWGPRTAHLFEIGTLGSFVSEKLSATLQSRNHLQLQSMSYASGRKRNYLGSTRQKM